MEKIPSQRKYLFWITLIVADFVTINASYAIAVQLLHRMNVGLAINIYRHHWIFYNFFWLSSVGFWRLYQFEMLQNMERMYRATIRTTSSFVFVFIIYLYATNDTEFTSEFVWIWICILCFGILINRILITIFDVWFNKNIKVKPLVAIAGFNTTAILLAEYFESHPLDYQFAGILDEGEPLPDQSAESLNDHLYNQLEKAVDMNIRDLYFSVPPQYIANAKALVNAAEDSCIRLKIVPDLKSSVSADFKVRYMNDFPVFSLRKEPLEDVRNRIKKRLFDIAFSSLVIVFILSWLYPIIAILIKWQSPGPVLFKQLRDGLNNKSFWCYKFRSMRVNNESDKRQATRHDERITPIGKFLRKSSLDEFPQFFNVFLGEMSVVGPRPHMISHTHEYSAVVDNYMVRHFVKPGITGWAQVYGFRGEVTNQEEIQGRVDKDIYYLENWSLMFDLRIVLLTFILVIKGDNKAF
jgi:Undecaprenyl-phosphate glucose phosphotransferase